MSSAVMVHDPASAELSTSSARPSVLRVSRPGDSCEREADRVADTLTNGGRVPAWSIAQSAMGEVQRDGPAVDPQAQKPLTTSDILPKLAEALLGTKAVKDLLEQLKDRPDVKSVTAAATSPVGIVVEGSAAIGAVSALAAAHKGLPLQIPKIPLDFIYPGMGVKLNYEGPVDHPKAASLTISFEAKGDKKSAQKQKEREKEQFHAETARMAADQEQFRAGMQPKGAGASAEDSMWEDAQMRRLAEIPGAAAAGVAGVTAKYPGLAKQEPATGLHMPELELPYKAPAPTLLGQKLELKPLTSLRMRAGEDKKEEVPVQRKAESTAEVETDAAAVNAVIGSSGRPLDAETRRSMESRMGFDFSKVRVHTDERAADSARSMHARAYTVGDHVVFGAGRYAPQMPEGRRLLAHELTHVVQQGGAARGTVQRQPPPASMPLRSRGRIPVAEAAEKFRQARMKSRLQDQPASAVRFRVPTGTDLLALWNSHTIPEAVFKQRLQVALTRMWNEFAIRSDEPIPSVIQRMFPAPGVFDESVLEKELDMSARFNIYKSVADSEAKIDDADKPRFIKAIDASIETIKLAEADDTNLTMVFGTKKDVAKGNYKKARAALTSVKGKLDSNVTTDYNLDDSEVGLGGWAQFATQKAHFEPEVVKVTDVAESEATIIHEASHLSNPAVDDKGYYGSPGFTTRSEDLKVTNAAHYEEVPRRLLGNSFYKDKDGHFLQFTPAEDTGGHSTETFEQKVRTRANEYFRMAWDKAVDVHGFLRGVLKEIKLGHKYVMKWDKDTIEQLSKLMQLTVHEQDDKTAVVNEIDVVLAEGIAHGTIKLQAAVRHTEIKPPLHIEVPPLPELKTPSMDVHSLKPGPEGPHLHLDTSITAPKLTFKMDTEAQSTRQVVEDTVKRENVLTGDFDRDMKLMDWLVAHYRKAI